MKQQNKTNMKEQIKNIKKTKIKKIIVNERKSSEIMILIIFTWLVGSIASRNATNSLQVSV